MKHLTRNNIILLVSLLALIVLSPLLRERLPLIGDLLLTTIFFSGIFSLEFSTKSLKILLPLGILTAATTWIGRFITLDIVYLVDNITTFLFLIAIVVLMIRHIALSRNVTPTIILSSINAYLLLGLLGGVLLAVADKLNDVLFASTGPGIIFPGENLPEFSDFVYLSFVTLSTLGYGDIIPLSHLTRATAVLIAVTGQMYMAILVAMLVGKFLSGSEGR